MSKAATSEAYFFPAKNSVRTGLKKWIAILLQGTCVIKVTKIQRFTKIWGLIIFVHVKTRCTYWSTVRQLWEFQTNWFVWSVQTVEASVQSLTFLFHFTKEILKRNDKLPLWEGTCSHANLTLFRMNFDRLETCLKSCWFGFNYRRLSNNNPSVQEHCC